MHMQTCKSQWFEFNKAASLNNFDIKYCTHHMIKTHLQTHGKRDWITGYFAFAFSRFFLKKNFKAPIHGKRAVIGSPWQIHFPSLPSSSFLHDSGLPLGKDKIHCKSSVALLIIHHCHCNSNKLTLNSWFPLALCQFRIDRVAEERKHRKNCECCPGHYLSTSVY